MSRVLVESGLDQGALWHSGAFSQEQRDLYAGQAWADLGHRPVILITGQDRLTWIHNLTTQHVLDLAPKLWVENLILSDRKSTRLNSSHVSESRMPSSA